MEEYALRLVVALIAGALIGAEREFRNKAAGFRTMILISTSAALFALVSEEVSKTNGTDPSRIAAQVVSGIGFLGAGVIIKDGASIFGLTTAATIWASAAVGMTIGFGFFEAGLVAGGILLAVLWLLPLVEYRIDALNETASYTVVYEGGMASRTHVDALVRSDGLRILRCSEGKEGSRWRLTLVAAGRHRAHEALVSHLLADDVVIDLQAGS